MKFFRAGVVFCLLFSPATMVYAVTLEECKELSLHNSRLLESYENGIKSALYARRKDLSALLPGNP